MSSIVEFEAIIAQLTQGASLGEKDDASDKRKV